MKKDNSLRVKKPTRQPDRQPSARWRSRAFWLEILFFLALGMFGFAAVANWLGDDEGFIIRVAAPLEEREVAQVALLYEAPSRRPAPEPTLAVIFMPSVQYWKDDLLAWGREYSVDPNLIATLMQIESCGDPDVESWAGATGLFQVMPFHFDDGEDMFDPATNAMRGIAYLKTGLEVSGGHAGLAMAGYNGGHGVISRSYETWPTETQRYYRWGSGIYREASAGWDSSPTLADWLASGGQSLCDQAEASLGLAAAY